MTRATEIATIIFDDAWNRSVFDGLASVFAPGCVFHSAGSSSPFGAAEQTALIEEHRRAFADLHFEIVHAIGEGDLVAIQLRITGTQTGDYGSLPASGRSVAVDEMLFMRLEDGSVTEIWSIFDTDTWKTQLGLT